MDPAQITVCELNKIVASKLSACRVLALAGFASGICDAIRLPHCKGATSDQLAILILQLEAERFLYVTR
jgi:hypothetical protein